MALSITRDSNYSAHNIQVQELMYSDQCMARILSLNLVLKIDWYIILINIFHFKIKHQSTLSFGYDFKHN